MNDILYLICTFHVTYYTYISYCILHVHFMLHITCTPDVLTAVLVMSTDDVTALFVMLTDLLTAVLPMLIDPFTTSIFASVLLLRANGCVNRELWRAALGQR
jgi:hypothetical protein